MQPKVCQLCAVDFTAKHFLLPLIDGMEQQGWSVTTVCSNGKFVAGMRENGYHVKTISIARSMNPLLVLRSLVDLVGFFRRERFDIVHVHTPIAALIGRLAAKMARVTFVIYTAHGFYFHNDVPPPHQGTSADGSYYNYYLAYKEEFYFWEMFKLLKKLIILLIYALII